MLSIRWGHDDTVAHAAARGSAGEKQKKKEASQ